MTCRPIFPINCTLYRLSIHSSITLLSLIQQHSIIIIYFTCINYKLFKFTTQPIYFNSLFDLENKTGLLKTIANRIRFVSVPQQPMNKENRIPKVKCSYCNNEAAGIIYRPSNDLGNALACAIHATNLFIPFKDSNYDKKLLSESRYRSPMKNSQFSQISQITPVQDNPETFFDKLMQNIIIEFNTMKKQLMTNYNAMKSLKKSQQALKFKMQGNNSYPYMLINNDQQMMMNHFIQRIQQKYNEQAEQKRRDQMAKRRLQISTILSSTNLPQSKFVDIKQVNSLFMSRSVQGSPEKVVNETSIEKSNQVTNRKPVMYRDYSRTQRRQKE